MSTITREELEGCFHMPSEQACRHLGYAGRVGGHISRGTCGIKSKLLLAARLLLAMEWLHSLPEAARVWGR